MSKRPTGLTQRQIERAQPGEIADPMCRGLRLIVSTTGAKSWEYRYRLDNRLRRIRLGRYPAIGLAEARDRWREAQKLRNDGEDPHEVRARARAEAARQRKAERDARVRDAFTVSVLVRDYLEHKSRVSKSHHTYKNVAYALNRIEAAFGDRPVAEVMRKDCKRLFERYADTPYAANRLVQWGRAMWNWAIDDERVEQNPWLRITQNEERPKERTLSTAELRALKDLLPNAGEYGDLLWLVLLTACRPGEIVHAHSEMVDHDERTLTITNTKNGSTHVVYLSEQAWAIVEPRLSDGWLFPSPSPRKRNSSLRVDTVAASLKAAIEKAKFPPFTPHDLRRTAATWLGEQEQCSHEVIQRILNHRAAGVTARHYNWAKLNQPAKRWWQAWADHLSALQAENVARIAFER